MNDNTNYWDSWAPYLSYLEDNYLDIESLNQLLGLVTSPILIVGAGQGLLVESLRQRGHVVDGVDYSSEMVKYAEKRRGIKLFHTDAAQMPFDDNKYASSIVATGVIDFITDSDKIKAIIVEVKRVTTNSGEILVAFYQMHPKVEKLMRYIGLISKDDQWCFRRTYEIMSRTPAEFFTEIRKDPNVSTLGAILTIIRTEIFMPKKEKAGTKRWKEAWERAKVEMGNPEKLISCAPENYPYRNRMQIQNLFKSMNVSLKNIIALKSCVIAQLS